MNNGARLKQTRAIVFSTLNSVTCSSHSLTGLLCQQSITQCGIKIDWLQLFSLFLRFSRPPCILFLLCANCINWRPLPRGRFWLCFGIAFASVMWIERYNTGFLKLKNRQLVVPCPALSVVKQKQSSAVFQGSRE